MVKKNILCIFASKGTLQKYKQNAVHIHMSIYMIVDCNYETFLYNYFYLEYLMELIFSTRWCKSQSYGFLSYDLGYYILKSTMGSALEYCVQTESENIKAKEATLIISATAIFASSSSAWSKTWRGQYWDGA